MNRFLNKQEWVSTGGMMSHNKSLRVSSLALILLAGVAATAVAQSVPKEVAALNTMPLHASAKSINGAQPDIEALRYYALRGEQDRVKAEIARLKQLYPTWQQPQNIFAPEDDNEKRLWDLYGKGDLTGLRAEIERLERDLSGFKPSRDLLSKVEQKEARLGIKGAIVEKKWQDAIDQANANPSLLLGDDLEVIWFLAEAYARIERHEEAFDAYLAALRASTKDDERKATVQKAAGLLSTERALALLEASPELRANETLAGEATDGIVRGALARMAQTGEAPPELLKLYIDGFTVRARMSRNNEDSILLAWAHFGQSQWAQADEWFNRAFQAKATPKAVEGAIMTSMRLGKWDRAAGLAGKWLHEADEIGALFISIHARELLKAKPARMAAPFLATYAAKTGQLKSGEGAEALGWYAYNIKQDAAARAWFHKAMEWEQTETAAFGLTLTTARQKDRNGWNIMQANYGTLYPRVAGVKFQVERKYNRVAVKRRSTKQERAGILRGKIARLQKGKRYRQCLQSSRKLRSFGPLNAGDQQMRGWCLLGVKRPQEAERAFAAAVGLSKSKGGNKSRVPSAYGQALSALRTGKTNRALAIANANPLTAQQRRVIDIELLTQRARAAFDNRDYGASIYALDQRKRLTGESRDLTFMRAWAHFHSRQLKRALALFQQLDNQLSSRESRRGIGAVKLEQNRMIVRSN
ncbi:MAG: hypothetical protein AAF903_00125 [Pseudomonadota bacterium]